jgi:hypothetical protein
MLIRLRGTQPLASDRYQHYLYLSLNAYPFTRNPAFSLRQVSSALPSLVFKCFSIYEEPGLQPQTGISTTFTWPLNAFRLRGTRSAFSLRKVSAALPLLGL